MKIRLNRDLYDAASVCAKKIDEPFNYFVGVAVRKHLKGEIENVADDHLWLGATSESVVATILNPGQPLDVIRLALASAVAHVQKITPPAFVPEETFIDGGDWQ